jgi:hypothetical protein
VVTEYWQKKSHHTAAIAVEVEYRSDAEIEEMIGELLFSFRQLYHPSVNETSTEDYERIEEEATAA